MYLYPISHLGSGVFGGAGAASIFGDHHDVMTDSDGEDTEEERDVRCPGMCPSLSLLPHGCPLQWYPQPLGIEQWDTVSPPSLKQTNLSVNSPKDVQRVPVSLFSFHLAPTILEFPLRALDLLPIYLSTGFVYVVLSCALHFPLLAVLFYFFICFE